MSAIRRPIGAYESWKSKKTEGKVVEDRRTSGGGPSKSTAPNRIKSCNTCARLAFHRPSKHSAICNYDDAVFEHDAGIFEIIYQVNQGEYYDHGFARHHEKRVVDDELARQTADAAGRRVNTMRTDMAEGGLIQRVDQNFCGEAKCARIIAPLHLDEIQLGSVLGIGGFSAVLDVSSINLRRRKKASKSDDVSEPTPDQYEELTRQYLAMHVFRYPNNNEHEQLQEQHDDNKKKKKSLSKPANRYALKHLRFNLATDPEKFKRSFIDLVLEGQLLLALDHPNIIGIRGWPLNGTEAIRSGRIMDYFLILDQLPVSLEVRMWEWRRALLKYKVRCSLPFFQTQKYSVKIDNLFRVRLQAVTKIASAIQYLHKKRIMHRDIKAANVGFDVRGDIKLFDFGLARILPNLTEKSEHSPNGEAAEGYCMSRVGTKFYIAPEVKDKKAYSLPADVYSFGVLFWEMISINSPRDVYYNRKKGRGTSATVPHLCVPGEEANKKKEGDRQTSLSAGWLPICPCWPEAVRSTILSCLSEDPRDRPSASEVHDILVDLAVKSLYENEGPEEERRRRRSTFRIDLSAFQKDIAGKCEFNAKDESIAEASWISKTSVESLHSFVESERT